MTTRRSSQYYIKSDGGVLRIGNDHTKGKGKGIITGGRASTQGSAISQRQVPEISIIFEPELELIMINSNGGKSHSEVSKRHLNELIQTVSHGLQGQRLGNATTNTPRSDEPLAHPQKIPQRGGNSEILQ
ncbi:hypothetical protein O181_002813 [Austropuccinia psidii MF-1]|uniref:Uncharacterized protein n=1 Tax=Austropuccinia psidii MF-1 TaxID=1389203 RepID=A0A9Q3BD79_9BASI|nr:hypothetical protein [Austropuccinia psidii MF-1]